MPADNWRFGAMAAVVRRKGSSKLKGSSPLKMYPMLPLRQAARTLYASGRERRKEGYRTERKVHSEGVVENRIEKSVFSTSPHYKTKKYCIILQREI